MTIEVINTNPKNPEDIIYSAGDIEIKAKHTTCWRCGGNGLIPDASPLCEHRWDIYNLHGDCLALK
jgi:hypothetical protein